MAVECADFHSKGEELKMVGLTIPDQRFYNISILGDESSGKANSIIQVIHGEAPKKKLEDELKNLINKHWDWHVRQMDVNEYTTVFLVKNSLETFSKISEILMSVHGLKVKIMKSTMDPDACQVLQTAWLKIHGMPSIALKERVVMVVASLAGEPLVVNELSLIKTGPVSVKLNYRDPSKLRGFARIIFNKVGYMIRFVSEKFKEKLDRPSSPPHREDDYDDGGDEEEESEEEKDRKHKRASDKHLAGKPLLELSVWKYQGGSSGREGDQAKKDAGINPIVLTRLMGGLKIVSLVTQKLSLRWCWL
jgi:hypothetical protein